MSKDDQLEDVTRDAVAAAIEASGNTDAAIAKTVGVSRAMVGNYRAAKHTVTLATAVALARALEITVDQLAGAAPPPDRSPRLLEVADRLTTWADSQAALAELMRDAAQTVGSHAGQALGETETG